MGKTEIKPENKKKKKEKKKKKGFFRENFESILIAVALAFVLRIFVVEAFKIPTGSMAPTLLGQHKAVKCPNCSWKFESDHNTNYVICTNCSYKIRVADYMKRGGNRILVNKFAYDFGKPKRWDVTVFKFPFSDNACLSCGNSWRQSTVCEQCSNTLKKENYIDSKFNSIKSYIGFRQYHEVFCKTCNSKEVITCSQCGSSNVHVILKNYIKRMIGLSNEKLQIVNGDIYIDGQIQRKPPKVQKKLWVPVFNSNYPEKQDIVENWWEVKDKYWNTEKRQLHLKVPKGYVQTSYAKFSRDFTDYNTYNGKVANTIVADIMLNCDIEVSRNSGGISIIMEKDEKVFEVFIRSENEEKQSYLKVSGDIIARDDKAFIGVGREINLEFSNVDKLISLKLDNALIFSHAYETDILPSDNYTRNSKLLIGGTNIEASFRNITISRDIYYSNVGEWGTIRPVELGDKEYFVLGDNSRNSNDSRFWKTVPEDSLVGRAFGVFWPITKINFIR